MSLCNVWLQNKTTKLQNKTPPSKYQPNKQIRSNQSKFGVKGPSHKEYIHKKLIPEAQTTLQKRRQKH